MIARVAIPLAEMTADRVLAVLYALMDSAYDAKQIHAHTEELGQVSITDSHPRRSGESPRRRHLVTQECITGDTDSLCSYCKMS